MMISSDDIWIFNLDTCPQSLMLKPTKLKDFDDGQAFLPHYDYSTSVEDFGYFCVFFRTIV